MKLLITLAFCVLQCLLNVANAAACSSDAMGTFRTVTLKREAALYGTKQHMALHLNRNEVVLTFDDGPSPENTPLVLKALVDQCTKASFFMIGQQLERHPELAPKSNLSI
nr:polysaccharide deacetylase family protein [uncultured Undibacterium sp.]